MKYSGSGPFYTTVRTNLLKVTPNRQGLIAQPQIRRDGNTVLSRHGYNGATVVLHDRL